MNMPERFGEARFGALSKKNIERRPTTEQEPAVDERAEKRDSALENLRRYGKRAALAAAILAPTLDTLHTVSAELQRESIAEEDRAALEEKVSGIRQDMNHAIDIFEAQDRSRGIMTGPDAHLAHESLRGEVDLGVDLRTLHLESIAVPSGDLTVDRDAVYLHLGPPGAERDFVYLVNKESVKPVTPATLSEGVKRVAQDRFVEPVLGDQDYVYTVRAVMLDSTPFRPQKVPMLHGAAVDAALIPIATVNNAEELREILSEEIRDDVDEYQDDITPKKPTQIQQGKLLAAIGQEQEERNDRISSIETALHAKSLAALLMPTNEELSNLSKAKLKKLTKEEKESYKENVQDDEWFQEDTKMSLVGSETRMIVEVASDISPEGVVKVTVNDKTIYEGKGDDVTPDKLHNMIVTEVQDSIIEEARSSVESGEAE